MQIKPDREKFSQLIRSGKRAPVCGEEAVPELDPALLYRGLFGDSPDSFLFESGNGPYTTARYSLMGRSNSRSIQIKNNTVRFSHNGTGEAADPLRGLERMNFEPEAGDAEYLPHFWGGWVGYAGYETAWLFEKLPRRKKDDLDLPDVYFMQVDRLAVYDRETGVLRYIVAPESAESEDYDRLVQEVGEAWDRIRAILGKQPAQTGGDTARERPGIDGAASGRKPRSNMTKAEYMTAVERAKFYISEGDIYQANLAQRFETDFAGDPFDLYLRLRAVNPSPFSGYLKLKDFALVSSSPERLVKVEGARLETRPIAGTRPRGKNAEEDRRLARDLMLNEKEKAEHLMLVDLERNDLGRICRFGSVRVTDLMFLEKYSHVSHIVSNIRGTLSPGVAVPDILRAVFPGGTITGCPKIRCMEIIDELEPTARGPYSGSFGYIGFSKYMDLNIIIRTLVVKNGKAYFHAGAGIVADSDPEREYQETLDKAAAMMEALCPQPGDRR